jgi:hypothetical protein
MPEWTDLLQSVEQAEPSPMIPARALARLAELGEQPAPRHGRKVFTVVLAGVATLAVLFVLALAAHSRGQTEPATPQPAPPPCSIGTPGCGPLPKLPTNRTPLRSGSHPDRGTPPLGLLHAGAYTNAPWDGTAFNLAFTVPTGWRWDGQTLSKGNAAIHFYPGRVLVYADPCHWDRPQHPAIRWRLESPMDIVNELKDQPNRYPTRWRVDPQSLSSVATRIWDLTTIRLTVPSNVDFASCDHGQYRTWGIGRNTRIQQGPGQRDLIAIGVPGMLGANIRGLLIIDAATFPNTPAHLVRQINAILASVSAGQWG